MTSLLLFAFLLFQSVTPIQCTNGIYEVETHKLGWLLTTYPEQFEVIPALYVIFGGTMYELSLLEALYEPPVDPPDPPDPDPEPEPEVEEPLLRIQAYKECLQTITDLIFEIRCERGAIMMDLDSDVFSRVARCKRELDAVQ